jgi:O-antigen/teichoic acid export membrane protein
MAAEAEANVRVRLGQSRVTALRGLFGKRLHRLGWGVMDQAVSSLTNFAIVLYVVRTVGAVQFGAFSLAYVTYGFVLSASRGLAVGPLQTRFSGTSLTDWRRAVAKCTGTATVGGLVSGIGVLVAAMAMSGTARLAFSALGLTLPGLLLQDSWRYAFFALGRGSQAFLNDLIWAIALLPALALLRVTHHQDVFWFVLAWGATANVAAAAGAWQARVVPSLSYAWGWVRQHGDLGLRYLAENTSVNGANQLRTYAVGIIVGLAAVGYLQAVNTLMGPFMVIYLGMTLVTVPEAVRALNRSMRHLRQFCLLAGIGLGVMSLGWGVVLLAALPRGLGIWLMGPIWRPAYPLVLPLTVSVIGACIGAGPTAGLHALGAARRSLRASVIGSVIYLAGGLGGAIAGGVLGTAWGVGLGTWIGALVWWWQLRVAMREFDNAGGSSKLPNRSTGRHRRQSYAPTEALE